MSDPNAVSGTPTFLFTDIEGSTRLLQRLGERYATLLEDHRRLISDPVTRSGGRVFGTEGDALFCAFPTAAGALIAAAEAQRALAAHTWPDDEQLRVRMGIHSGEAMLTGGDYVGLAVHQVARIMAAGHGGQVLVSEATRRLLATVPAGLELRDLGERRLKDLAAAERIYQLVGEGLEEHFPPLRTLDARTNNLPVQVTSFVGRAELAAARAALEETRLLSLTGPGGTGKTRLALQLAGEMSDLFEDGVFFVPLDSIVDPELAAATIASALGIEVTGTASPLDVVVDFLRDKSVLLLLDNFEQIVDAAGDVARIIRDAPRVKVIVTTRIVLHIYGEREFPVPPLGMPPSDAGPLSAEQAGAYEAVELFVDRARASQPTFTLTDDNAPLVIDITRRLDGLPLAIELAAARTRALPVAAIHARLDQHLALLTGGSRDLPGRQQTLRGAIDWSYDLLEGPDRELFERFSVHSGGAFLTQADAVCGPAAELGEDVLDGLTSLADKSLVRPDLDGFDDPRFAMLVTIRDYAHERLTSSPHFIDLGRRHAQVYLGLVESLSAGMTGPDARRVSDRCERDHDNIRAAIDWAVEQGEAEIAMRYIAAVWRFWQRRGHLAEARRRVDTVLGMPGVADQSDDIQAHAYLAAGSVTYWQADTHATYRYYEQALEAARRSGDKRLIADALYNHGFAAEDLDQPSNQLYRAGMPYWQESIALYRELDDASGIANASWGLAQAYGGERELDKALAYGYEALEGYRKLGDTFGIGWGIFMIAGFKAQIDETDEANELLRESMRIFVAANDRSGILLNLAGFIFIAQQRGQRVRELRLGGAAQALRASTGAGLFDAPVEMLAFVIPTRPTGDPAAEREWDIGTHMSAEEAAAYAIDEVDADKRELSGA